MVRSSANSLVRCATVIENVLKMMNAPTNTAIPANTSSSVLRKLRLFLIESAFSSACSLPVFTSTVSGITRSMRVTSSCGVTPGVAATWIESTFPRWSARSWATGNVTTETVAPPSDSTSPNLARPEIVKSRRPVRPTSETRSPIFRPSSSAVPLLIATSWGLAGGSPSTYSSGSNRSGGREKSSGGAPPVFTWSPFALKMEAVSSTLPAAVCHPGHVLDPAHERFRDLLAHRAVVGVELGAAADDHVDALVRGLEDLVEGAVDRVREHVGAGDHRDAEQDGEAGQHRAHLAREESADA